MADARPVTDDWVERDIMVVLCYGFLARRHRDVGDRLRVRCSLVPLPLATERNGLDERRASVLGAGIGRSNRIDAADGLLGRVCGTKPASSTIAVSSPKFG